MCLNLVPACQESLKCPECGHKSKRFSSFKKHILTHSDARPFKCEKCGATFKNKSYLARHLWVHTGVKKYSCEHCTKKFAHRGKKASSDDFICVAPERVESSLTTVVTQYIHHGFDWLIKKCQFFALFPVLSAQTYKLFYIRLRGSKLYKTRQIGWWVGWCNWWLHFGSIYLFISGRGRDSGNIFSLKIFCREHKA